MLSAFLDFSLDTMESLQNGFTKRWGVQSNPRALQGRSLPQILCATKLEDQAPKKDECILEKHSYSWVHHWFFFNHVAPKKDPHGSNEGPKSHHETNEEPDPSPCLAQAALAVTVPPHLPVGHRVDHQECNGGYDPTGMVGMVEVFHLRVFHSCIDDDPPACEELGERRENTMA